MGRPCLVIRDSSEVLDAYTCAGSDKTCPRLNNMSSWRAICGTSLAICGFGKVLDPCIWQHWATHMACFAFERCELLAQNCIPLRFVLQRLTTELMETLGGMRGGGGGGGGGGDGDPFLRAFSHTSATPPASVLSEASEVSEVRLPHTSCPASLGRPVSLTCFHRSASLSTPDQLARPAWRLHVHATSAKGMREAIHR